jgi:hypothetical protein
MTRPGLEQKAGRKFKIETEFGIVGTVYIPKEMGGEKLPKRIILDYVTKDS